MDGHKEDGKFHPHTTHESAIHSSDVLTKQDKIRKQAFTKIAKRIKKSKTKYHIPKNEDKEFDQDAVIRDKIKPETYLYLTKADEGITIFHKDDVESLNKINERLKHGKSLDTPELVINLSKQQVHDHDGRHRAIGAMQSGIKQMPVIEAGEECKGKKCEIIPIKDMTKKEKKIMHDFEHLKPQNDADFDIS